jgi:hypothetical protein
MHKNINRFRQSVLDVSGTWGVAIAILLLSFLFAYQFVKPAPPKHLLLATGQDGGAYQHYGRGIRREPRAPR